MKKPVSLATLFSLLITSAFAIDPSAPDTTAQCSYFMAGKEIKGTVKMYKEDYHRNALAAETLFVSFTKEDGKDEKIDFAKVDSLLVGDLFYAKTRYSDRSITSMSKDDLNLARIIYKGSKASAYYHFAYDSKEKSYYSTLIVDKVAEKKPSATGGGMWMIAFKKQLAKLFNDCETVSKKAMEKAYGTGDEAIINATKDYDLNCQ